MAYRKGLIVQEKWRANCSFYFLIASAGDELEHGSLLKSSGARIWKVQLPRDPSDCLVQQYPAAAASRLRFSPQVG